MARRYEVVGFANEKRGKNGFFFNGQLTKEVPVGTWMNIFPNNQKRSPSDPDFDLVVYHDDEDTNKK